MKALSLTFCCLALYSSFAGAATLTMTNAIGGVSNGTSFTVGTIGTQPQPGNNWPSAEPPGAAIDGIFGNVPGSTKYLNFFQTNTGLIVTPNASSSNLAIDTLTFWTANDTVGRDPTSFILYGSTTVLSTSTPGTAYPIASLTVIGSGALSLTDTRLSGPTSEVNFVNDKAYASYLLVFPTVKFQGYDGTNNSMQIGEIIFDGHLAIPEPGSAMLLLAGLVPLARRRRSA
ncbi:MAG TPA: hypothetical protein VHM91_09235 [Verrucomicrobiales bacterium]|nr:hypothetical protein [Verrucomicrobiales bacterium]